MRHEKECRCKICEEGIEAFIKQQEESLEKYGWYAHVVQNDEDMPLGFNMHTHHFEDIGQKDVQIVLPIDPKILLRILHDLYARLKDGLQIEASTPYDKILSNYNVMFIAARESDRYVWRMILPDKEGNLKLEDMIDPTFAKQFENTGLEFLEN